MSDLFGTAPAAHDPGGKSKFRLLPGMVGSADISPCGRFRPVLYRDWGGKGTALWIGMNPSTAEGDIDDPTVRREIIHTRDRLGLGRYVKANVMDFRATDPKRLLSLSGAERCSPANLRVIAHHAAVADRVVCAWGALPKALRIHAEAVVALLAGIDLWCLGFTKDGSPRHPLYVRGDAQLVRYAP